MKKIEGHKGQPWAKLSETITPGKQNARYIKILLEANIGNGVFSDMAVDDIEISNRQCGKLFLRYVLSILSQQTKH